MWPKRPYFSWVPVRRLFAEGRRVLEASVFLFISAQTLAMRARHFRLRNGLILPCLIGAALACSDQVLGPETNVVAARAGSTAAAKAPYTKHKKSTDDIDARAATLLDGKTWLEVSTGTLPWVDEVGNVIVVPGLGTLRKVHVKFCKDYKSLGVHQFSANFSYKGDAIDKEPDLEPDSPLDPDDKDHKQVNWDRSATHTTLDGSDRTKIAFTGIPEGATLELQVLYTYPDDKKPGTFKNYEIKFCVPVESAPDIGFTTAIGGTQGRTDVATDYGYAVDVLNSTSIPVNAQCAVYVDGVFYARSSAWTLSSQISHDCSFPIQFATGGAHTLRFVIENADPGDYDPTNNEVTRVIQVADLQSGIISARFNPTIIENVITKTTKDVKFVPTRELDLTGGLALPSQTSQTLDQSSILTIDFDREFTYPVKFELSQTSNEPTGPRLIHSITTTINSCTQSVTAILPIGYGVTFCNGSGTSTLSYRTNAKASIDQRGRYSVVTGTFLSYGSSITYGVKMTTADGKVYSTSITTPIRTITEEKGTTPVCESPFGGSQLCHFGITNEIRRDGSGVFSISLPPL
jgi:hypothetical protein